MTYIFSEVDKSGTKEIGRTDDLLNVISGKPQELLERVPRILPFRFGSHLRDEYQEHSQEVSVGQPGYGMALQDWLINEGVALDYEE